MKSSSFLKSSGKSFGLLCQAQAFPVPLIRSVWKWLTRIFPQTWYYIPFNGTYESFANVINNRIFVINHKTLIETEPIGYKAPSLSSNAESITFKHAIGQSFGLLCQAQAFPVPVFRYKTPIFDLSGLEIMVKHTNFPKRSGLKKLLLINNKLLNGFKILHLFYKRNPFISSQNCALPYWKFSGYCNRVPRPNVFSLVWLFRIKFARRARRQCWSENIRRPTAREYWTFWFNIFRTLSGPIISGCQL